MTDTPPRRRRGRPPSQPVEARTTIAEPADYSPDRAALAATAHATHGDGDEAAPAPTARRRRKAVGGYNLKLAAPQREGYFRRWFVDRPGRLAEAEELAYEHVRDTSIKSDGTDSRIRRLTGTDGHGAPQYSYLMETPLSEYQAGIDDKEEAHATFEASIRRGEDPSGQLIDAYGEGKIEGSTRAS